MSDDATFPQPELELPLEAPLLQEAPVALLEEAPVALLEAVPAAVLVSVAAAISGASSASTL